MNAAFEAGTVSGTFEAATFEALAGRPVVIGGGAAGLATALSLAPEPVVLLTRAPLGGDGSSPLAQGGMAASVGEDDDAALHLADTLAAGDGLVDAEVARAILDAAPAAIAALDGIGVPFDRTTAGGLALGLEAAHSRRRIVHADGDGTGRALTLALAKAVRACPSITVIEGAEGRRILVSEGAVAGVLVAGGASGTVLRTRRVVLATGGVGALFEHTTNPLSSFGTGLALAARAGAQLADLEFVQFHPTALATEIRPLSLISEAVRGEGALLVDEAGNRFMADTPGAELAPRDVVARGVWRHLAQGHEVYLDARACLGAGFAARFPTVAAGCRAGGIDPATDLIPIRPAAHYHMGGVAVDATGRSTVPGLWAVGEVAATGLHGANRLASNSLIEAVVAGRAAAEDIKATEAGAQAPRLLAEMPAAPEADAVRPIVSRFLGVERDGAGLAEAVAQLLPLAEQPGPDADAAIVALMMAVSALKREESRGAHCRLDFPARAATARRSFVTLDGALAEARLLARAPALARTR